MLWTSLLTLPNILTLIRMFSIVFVVLFFLLPYDWTRYAAAIVFALAALTDWLDGYVARIYSMQTKLGELLDPVADKILVSTAIVLMVAAYDNLLMVFIAIIIIGREIMVMAIRSWMAEQKSDMIAVKVSWISKIKTFLQLLGIACFFAFPPHITYTGIWDYMPIVTLFIMVIASVMTIYSAYFYAQAMLRHVDDEEER